MFKDISDPRYISQGFEYSRSGNPTRNAMEKCFASLEKAKYGKKSAPLYIYHDRY